MDDAHHGSSHAHVDDLSHLRQKIFLNLKTALPDAPAAIHQERKIDLTVWKTVTHHAVKLWWIGITFLNFFLYKTLKQTKKKLYKEFKDKENYLTLCLLHLFDGKS